MSDLSRNSTLASAGGYYLAYTLLRILAAQLVDSAWATIHSTSLSALQLGLLAACALLISYIDLQSRPAQAASALGFRIISALVVRPYFKSVPWGREAGDWVPWLLRYRAGGGSLSLSSSSPNSLTGSDGSSNWSGKDVSSFRIPDRKLKARAARANHQQQQRYRSGYYQQRIQPSWARTTRLESPSLTPPVTSPTIAGAAAGVSPFSRSKSMPIEPTAPTSPSPLSPRSPLHFTLGVGRTRNHPHYMSTSQQQQQQQRIGGTTRSNRVNYSIGGAAEDSALSTGTVFNPNARRSSTTIGGDLLRRASTHQGTATTLPINNNNNNNNNNAQSFSFSPPSSEGCRTPDLVTAATWTSQATASLSSLTARVDAIIRPLVPPAPSNLIRWPSSPASWSFRPPSDEIDQSGGDGGVARAIGDVHATTNTGNRHLHVVVPPVHKSPAGRRVSLDANHGCSSRHYTHGGIAADASRRSALERYAYAARMSTAGSEKATAFSAFPGRVLRATSSSTSNLANLDTANAISATGNGSAVASIGLDGDCPESIRQLITDEHLLQLGALMGESACEAVIKDTNLPFACTVEDSLCGAPDHTQYTQHQELNNSTNTTNISSGWEELTAVKNQSSGLRLRSWRLLMRKGLYAYKTVVEIDGVDPEDIRPFHLDDQARALWDDGALEVLRPTPEGCSRASRHAESCLHSYLSKFPGPLASRRYNYARRVWHRPSDGGCYTIAQGCEITSDAINAAAAHSANGGGLDLQAREKIRAVPVLEFTSAAVIRAVAGGSEISTFYFEDSQVRAGLAKVAVPKGLWPFWTKYEAALRLFADARAVAHSLPLNDDAPGATPTTTATAPPGNANGTAAAAARRRVPTNFDAWNGGSFALNYDGNDSDGEGSDDELYGALVQLKAARKRAADRKGGALGVSTRWARRIVIAGALKMVQVMLASN